MLPRPTSAAPAMRMPASIRRLRAEAIDHPARDEPEERPDQQLAVGVARCDLLARPAELADHVVVEERQAVQGHAHDREQREKGGHRDVGLGSLGVHPSQLTVRP